MLHLNMDPERVNVWLLNFVMFAFALLELVLTAYVTYLIIHHIPNQ